MSSSASAAPLVAGDTYAANDLREMFIDVLINAHKSNNTTVAEVSGHYHEQFFSPSAMSTTSSEYGLDIVQLIRVVYYFIYSLIFVVGLVGNVLVCFVVFRTTSMHSVTNIFIANLALSDILLCLLSVPFTPLYLLIYEGWVFGSALCHLVPFAQGASVYISVLTLMSIAIERYSVIVHPFRAPITISHSIIIIIAIWVVSFLLTLPLGVFIEVIPLVLFPAAVGNTTTMVEVNLAELYASNTTRLSGLPYDDVLQLFQPKLYCDELWPHENIRVAFGLVTTVIQFIIPFFIIAFCYMKVCARLWDRIRTRPGSMNYSSQRKWLEKERAKRTNSMLISMVVIFAFSWLPLNIYNLFEDFYFPVSHWKHSRTFFLLIHVIAMSSTCYNPFLYAWLNDNFRKEFKCIFVPLCARLRCLLLTGHDGGPGGLGTKDSSGHVVVALHNTQSRNILNGETYNNAHTNITNLHSNRTPETKSARLDNAVIGENDNDNECISMTLIDTTTNMVTNLESINEAELQESLWATSQRNELMRAGYGQGPGQFTVTPTDESTTTYVGLETSTCILKP